MTTPPLTEDAQATLLLCSHLALPRGQEVQKVKPLTDREWHDLAQRLWNQGLRPSDLLHMDGDSLTTRVGLTVADAGRILLLLGRGAQLAVELERLSNHGIWTLTRSDGDYPHRLKERLGGLAPAVLFGVGDRTLLGQGFLAVVGSRDVDEAGERFAVTIGQVCAEQGYVVVSGGARGVDRVAVHACLEHGGRAIQVLAGDLEKTVREPLYRQAALDGRLVIVSAAHPRAPFSVANAMARNKYIYCLAQYGLVVSAAVKSGGTRAGALEVIRHRWVPLFVRSGADAPPGNQDLIRSGGLPFPDSLPKGDILQWFQANAVGWVRTMPARGKVQAPARLQEASAVQSVHEDGDLFPIVWPHIGERLERFDSLEELAAHLKVEPVQLRHWLERAVEGSLSERARSAIQKLLGPEQLRFEV